MLPEWLKTYLAWWNSQVQSWTDMTFFDFAVSIPLMLIPLIIGYYFLGGFAKKKKDDTGWNNPNKSPLSKSIDDR
ncbi:hypothetical protein [Rheinheimera hassiensis]|uniref:hypothetical protein n=1 Tax=Rheinheimera hassiensis TaxID=1193627 RepID=UPI001F068906|nr:hypothetical protein [Rheinheimera hassiensis]